MNQVSPTKNTPNFRIFSSLLPSTPTPQSANSMWNNQLYTIQCFITEALKDRVLCNLSHCWCRSWWWKHSIKARRLGDDGNTRKWWKHSIKARRPRLWTMPREWTARHLGTRLFQGHLSFLIGAVFGEGFHAILCRSYTRGSTVFAFPHTQNVSSCYPQKSET